MESQPEMKPVESSNVESVGYVPDTRVLSVKFRGRPTIYRYQGVPPEIVEQFMNADSKGRFMRLAVIGKFTVEKAEPASFVEEGK